MNDLKFTKLPKNISKNLFDCIEQQFMTLCYFYENEFWKLFLSSSLKINTEYTYIEDLIDIKSSIIDMAEKYYNIIGIELSNNHNLTFDDNQVYLIRFDLRKYPHSKKADIDIDHYFIVYGENEHSYFVNDNYYNNSNFILDKKIYNCGVIQAFLIQKKYKNSVYNCYNDVLSILSNNYYDSINYVLTLIESSNKYNYNSANLFDKIHALYCLLNKDAIIVHSYSNNDLYLNVCSDILFNISNQINIIYFSFIKAHLKFEIIPNTIIIKMFRQIEQYLLIEKRVKSEIINIITKCTGLKEKIEDQIKEYLEIDEIDIMRSVYEDHENLAVMFLLNYLEEKNEIDELNYILYKDKKTYGEYILVTFKYILTDGVKFDV